MSGTASQVVLGAVLDSGAAADLKRILVEALGEDGFIEVDADAVRRVSTPCLQMLVAAASGGRLLLSNVPPEMKDAAALLGLSEALGLEGELA